MSDQTIRDEARKTKPKKPVSRRKRGWELAKWRKEMAREIEIIRQSEILTGDDLKLRIR